MKYKNTNFKKYIITFCIFLLFIEILPCNANPIFKDPTSNKYINDYVGIVNEEDSKKIVSIGYELERKSGAQAVIVIIDSLEGYDIESYANKLFRTWGIGEKDKNNGLLILLSMNDKQFRVEVGSGLEGAIPDALSNRVMESLAKPKFSEGNYGLGLLESYSTFCDLIAEEYNITLEKSLNIPLPPTSNSSSNSNVLIISGIILALVLLDVLLNKGRILNTLLQLAFISNLGGRGPRGGSGGFGGGSGGGGFGGFGGGSSNGGGSSGNW